MINYNHVQFHVTNKSQPISSEIRKYEIPVKLSSEALTKVIQEIKYTFKLKKCQPEKTLFAFDIDDTVLRRSEKTGFQYSIRKSDVVIRKLNQLQVKTIAVTSRPAELFSIAQDDLNKVGIYPSFRLKSELDSKPSLGQNTKKESELLVFSEVYDYENSYNNTTQAEPYYSYFHGIISTGHKNKGRALKFILSLDLVNSVECLFFVDDMQENINDMENSFLSDGPNPMDIYLIKVPNQKELNEDLRKVLTLRNKNPS